MARLKASVAHSELDRDLHTHIADAQASLRRALEVCRAAGHGQRAFEIQRSLQMSFSNLDQIGHLAPQIQTDDPDLMTEEQLSVRAAARRQEKKKVAPVVKYVTRAQWAPDEER